MQRGAPAAPLKQSTAHFKQSLNRFEKKTVKLIANKVGGFNEPFPHFILFNNTESAIKIRSSTPIKDHSRVGCKRKLSNSNQQVHSNRGITFLANRMSIFFYYFEDELLQEKRDVSWANQTKGRFASAVVVRTHRSACGVSHPTSIGMRLISSQDGEHSIFLKHGISPSSRISFPGY